MRLKTIHSAILFGASLFASQAAFAANTAEPVLSGKPYRSPTNIDTNLPDLGDVSQTVLSPQDEQRIAEQILREVAISDEVLQDVEVTDYLQQLGEKLANSGPDKNQVFNFFVVTDNSINAFAMPGGVIGVHTGLIMAANNESELASVLGHEIGHVTQRHLARMLAAQKYDTFKNIASIALALLVSRANPELASGALTTAQAAGVQRQLDYTREHEREADRVGLSILDAAGFDARAMPAFFTTMQRGTRFTEGSAPSFLRTHPLTAERIADVSNRVDQLPYKQVADKLEFHLVRAKLRAGQGLAQAAIEQFQDNIKEKRYGNESAEHYGLALAYLRKNDVTNATKQVDWLKKNAVKHAFFENLSARIEVAKNNVATAGAQYTKAIAVYPNHRSIIYGYAEHLLASNQADKAIKLTLEKQSLYPNDAYLYALLSRAYGAKGKVLLRHQAQGEAYYRQYDLNRAIEQLDLAVKAKDGNFYEKSIAEARLRELRQKQAMEKVG